MKRMVVIDESMITQNKTKRKGFLINQYCGKMKTDPIDTATLNDSHTLYGDGCIDLKRK